MCELGNTQLSGQPRYSKVCSDGERMLRTTFKMFPRTKTNSGRHLNASGRRKNIPGDVSNVSAGENKVLAAFKIFPDGERILRTTPKTLPRAKTNSGRHLKCFRTAKECSGRRLKRFRVRKHIPDGV
jgi:hypothetical protein